MAPSLSFQAFTMKANGLSSKIITDITVSAAFDPAQPTNPLPASLPARALWDTGASRSVVSADVVRTLSLPAVGSINVHHGDGSSVRGTYLVNFQLPNGVGVVGILATEFPASHSDFSVLVGMDVISLGDFSITNVNKETVVSFRTPSCESIDYVVAANKIRFAGTSRNAPCPCGSGNKFKFCHGASR